MCTNLFLPHQCVQVFLGLLQAGVSDLGFYELSVEGLSNLKLLGRGGSCVAFEALKVNTYTQEEEYVVVKIFDEAKHDVLNNEVANLSILQRANVVNVPECIRRLDVCLGGKPCTKRALVCTPVGKCILPLKGGQRTTGQHLSELVTILEGAHSAGIAHRDVKPDNIFLVNDDHILLNDWGISCMLSDTEMVVWKGSRGYSDPPDDMNSGMHYPSKAKDLRSLVRCAYSMLFLEQPTNVDDYWQYRLAPQLWRDAMTAADSSDYEKLRIIFISMK